MVERSAAQRRSSSRARQRPTSPLSPALFDVYLQLQPRLCQFSTRRIYTTTWRKLWVNAPRERRPEAKQGCGTQPDEHECHPAGLFSLPLPRSGRSLLRVICHGRISHGVDARCNSGKREKGDGSAATSFLAKGCCCCGMHHHIATFPSPSLFSAAADMIRAALSILLLCASVHAQMPACFSKKTLLNGVSGGDERRDGKKGAAATPLSPAAFKQKAAEALARHFLYRARCRHEKGFSSKRKHRRRRRKEVPTPSSPDSPRTLRRRR